MIVGMSTRQRLSLIEVVTLCLGLLVVAAMAVHCAREVLGHGQHDRQIYYSDKARVITITPMELGLTYEEIGERIPGSR